MAAQRNVLVMVAMEEEAQYLKPYLENPTEVTLRGIPYAVLRGTIMEYKWTSSSLGSARCTRRARNVGGARAQTTPLRPLGRVPTARTSRARARGDVVLGSEVVPLDPVVVERHGRVAAVGRARRMTAKATMSWACDEKLTSESKQRRRAASSARGEDRADGSAERRVALP